MLWQSAADMEKAPGGRKSLDDLCDGLDDTRRLARVVYDTTGVSDEYQSFERFWENLDNALEDIDSTVPVMTSELISYTRQLGNRVRRLVQTKRRRNK